MNALRKICLLALLSCFSLEASTIPVTSLDDSGAGTLREALTNAVSDDTIEFDSELSGSIILESALPDITVPLTIVGPASGLVTVDGNDLYPLFNVQSNVTITQLNLANGIRENGGGAVLVDTNYYAALVNLTITLSNEEGGADALYAEVDGQIGLSDVTFSSLVPEVYLDSGILVISNTIETDTVVHGGGSAFTLGTTVNLLTPSVAPVDLFLGVVDGQTSFTGVTIEPLLTYADGILYGTYAADSLINYGISRIGDSSTISSCLLINDFYQASGGALHIKIDPAGNTDQLIASGYAFLDGTLTILPESGTYLENTVYTFLLADGYVIDEFNVVTPVPGLDFQVNYNSNSVEIVILSESSI